MTDSSKKIDMPISFTCHASNLSSVGPPNSATHKGSDNRRGEDARFDF